MANIPDNRFISATSLQEYFVDKSSGLPLSNGAVYFYRDTSRTTFKSVYQLTGDPNTTGGYSFTPLNNPLNLSATGTFVDNNGNNIAVYYFPYDGTPNASAGNIELYYIVAVDAAGAMQFNRAAWPSISEDIVAAETNVIYQNQMSNSQFVDVFFSQTNSASYSYAAGNISFQIAPDWEIAGTATGNGTLTVTRNLITGISAIPTNPPYTLTVVPGANLTTLSVRQRLKSNPGIWSPTSTGEGGYISGSILLARNSQVTMVYVPSTGQQTQILTKNNTSLNPVLYNQTVRLPLSTNSSNPSTGYASIYLNIPAAGAGTTFSSVQVVGLATNQTSVPYIQQPVNRQNDYLFHYYNSLLQFKPVKSYLTGWDFPLNPAQFGTSGSINGSVNKSAYAWDQTIIYTSASTGVSYGAHPTTSGLRITATTGSTQIALVQYLDQVAARALLLNDLSVNVSMSTSNPSALNGTVSLWYTTAASLPNVATGSNQSIVQTLTANGDVNTTFGTGWTRVSRTLIGGSDSAPFIVNTATPSSNYFNTPLSGWGANNQGATSATFFAIVVGFSSLSATERLDLNSISLVPGQIATIPAPQNLNEVLRDCEYYYSQSYPSANLARTETTLGQKTVLGIGGYPAGIELRYPEPMRKAPVVTFYPPYNNGGAITAGNMSLYYESVNGSNPTLLDIQFHSSFIVSANYDQNTIIGAANTNISVFYRARTNITIGSVTGTIVTYHFIADARLGII